MTPCQLLLEAAQIIEVRGLAKGCYVDFAGRVDLMSALRIAAHGDYATCPPNDHPNADAYWEASAFLRAVLGGSPSQWNDRPNVTTDDAIALLRNEARHVRV